MVSGRRCGRCSNPGVRLFLPYFEFLSGQLEAFYDSDLPFSLTVFSYSFIRVLSVPCLSLLSSSSSSHYHPCLSHSCPHLAFVFPQIHNLSVVMSSFCFLPCNVLHHTHIFPTSSWFDAYYIIPLTNLIHVNVIGIHSTTLRVCMSMFHSFLPCPGLIVILPSSLLRLVRVLFIGLVSTIFVFHTTHMRPFPFLLRNPALLIFALLHTPPLCLSR